jgi:type VII secretion protein EccB
MQSRRDQVQAQSYVLGRLTTALVSGEPDTAENPHRRTVVGTVVGLLLAAIGVGGFTVYGFLQPGGANAWRAAGVLVVEKETGNRYVYADDRLRPVLNYASARLLFPRPPKVVTVSAKSLRGVPHGNPLGIVGAPDALPPAGHWFGHAWTACAHAEQDRAGTLHTATSLAVSAPGVPFGGRVLQPGEAFVVAAGGGPDQVRYLIWQHRRFRLVGPWLPRVLGADGAASTVETLWLDTVPAGPDLTPLAVAGRGEPGPRIEGEETKVGQLFVTRAGDGAERYRLLQRDGWSDLTPLAYTILAGDPATAKLYPDGAVRPHTLSPAGLTGLPRSPAATVTPDLPAELPRLLPAGEDPVRCVSQVLPGGAPTMLAGAPVGRLAIVSDGVGVTRTSRTARAVAVTPGSGGLVRSGRPGQAPGADLYLVTDAGIKYPVAGAEAATRLGYDPNVALAVSRALLELLPTGPMLQAPTHR